MEQIKNRLIQIIDQNLQLSKNVTEYLEAAKNSLLSLNERDLNRKSLAVIQAVREKLKEAGKIESKELDEEQQEMILLSNLEEQVNSFLGGR
ncbi:MAG: hypothetical protein ACOCXG_02510 [Nanoarchaeota archaeon]